MSRTRLVRLAIGLIALATLPPSAEHLLARPRMPESLLVATRGASYNYTTTAINSCAGIGAGMFFNQGPFYNGNLTVADCTPVANAGAPCGGCAVTSSSPYGVTAQPVAAGTLGQINGRTTACGNLMAGTCGLVPLPPGVIGPPAPGCVTQGVYLTATGDTVTCGSLTTIGNQQVPAGPVIPNPPYVAGP